VSDSRLDALRAMKREGRKIVGIVAWDTPTARAADRAGVDLVSVGDSVAVSLWGRDREGDLSLDELLLVCCAVRRGVEHALVSCDLPNPSVDRARRLVTDGGADLVKAEGGVAELAAAGIDVFAQLSSNGDPVAEAKRLEAEGAALLDFRHSGPEAGARVAEAVDIPVLGGLGGGPWLDGRLRSVHRLLDAPLAEYVDDVRAGRPVPGD
jgi:3-methyl-2-oxobutanoate hydroxymethyltransferase